MLNPFGIADAWLPLLTATLAPAPDLTVLYDMGRFNLSPGETGDTLVLVTVTNTVTGASLDTLLDVGFAPTSTDTLLLSILTDMPDDSIRQAIRTLVQEPAILDLDLTLDTLDGKIETLRGTYDNLIAHTLKENPFS